MESVQKPIKPAAKKKPIAKKKLPIKPKSVKKHGVMTRKTFTEEMGNEICRRISGGESLRKICTDESIFGMTAVINELAKNPDFAAQYAKAREAQADFYAAEIIEISDDGFNDTYETENGTKTNQDVIARSRLRVDARKWYASKLAPKKYGDKMDVNHGGQKENPISALLSIVQGNSIPTASPEPEDDSE